MSVFQVINGPDRLPLQGGGDYGVVFSYDLGSPMAPFDSSKREYWVHATGEGLSFDGEDIAGISELQNVAYNSCTHFVKFLLGKNGGPPSFPFNRVSIKDAMVADRPDLFGSSPNIPGWTTTGHTYVQFTGTASNKSFQGVMLRRVNVTAKTAEEYWLCNMPNGYLDAGDDVSFLGSNTISPSKPLTPKELVTSFPNWLPNPSAAGNLKNYFFWCDNGSWLTLSSDDDDWQQQVCG